MFEAFKNLNRRYSESFLIAVKKKTYSSARPRWPVLSNCLGMMHTVLLHCPNNAEVWTAQSDLRILL